MNDATSSPSGSLAFAGDGMTEAGRWADWLGDYVVHNLGRKGDTTQDLLERCDEIIDCRPDAIAVLIGTNDFGARRSVEHVVRTLQLFLVTMRRELPGARLLLQSILPRERELAEQIQDANRHLRQFSNSINGQYLDLWPTFALADGEINPELADDRLHPNEPGYAAWVNELRPGLERLYDLPPMSRPLTLIRSA